MHSIRRRSALGLLAAAAARPAGAQGGWPSRPVAIIATFPAGGSTDFAARALAQGFASAFGQPAAVDNRTGAGGLIGTELVVRARPDGHTLLVVNFSTLSMIPHIMEGVTFNPFETLTPVGLVMEGSALMAVHSSVPASNLTEFAAWARAQPNGVAYGSSGPGSQMAMEILRAGIEAPPMTHVPYRGSAPALQDFLPGRILAMIDSTPALLPHVQSGALKPILVTGPRRSSQLPAVPTSTEAGVPALVLNNWEGLFVPRGTPEPIVTRLNAYLNQVVADREIRQRMLDRGAEPGGGTPADLAATLRADYDRWGSAARTYNIRAG